MQFTPIVKDAVFQRKELIWNVQKTLDKQELVLDLLKPTLQLD